MARAWLPRHALSHCLGIATLYLLTPGSGPASAALPTCYLSRYNGDALSRHPSRTVAKMRFSFGVSDAAAVGLVQAASVLRSGVEAAATAAVHELVPQEVAAVWAESEVGGAPAGSDSPML